MAVFKNDPFELVWTAFKNIYPDKECECWLVEEPDKGFGYVDLPYGGGTPAVYIDGNLSIVNAAEILAQELAHVAVWPPVDDDEWDYAFNAIYEEYNRLLAESESEEVEDD